MHIPVDLVEACRRGDTEAFEQLVKATQRSVYSLVFRIVGNHEDAADVTQEVYLKVWRSLKGFRGDSTVSSWLYRVASNAAISYLRKRGRLAEPVTPERLERPAPEPAEQAVDPAEVAEALQRLPAAYRTVLVLREMYDMSMEEIAKQMDTTPGAVKVRLHRARLRMADELREGGVVIPLHREKQKRSS